METVEKTPEQMLREVKDSVKTEVSAELEAKLNEQVRSIIAEVAKPKIEVEGPRDEWRAVREQLMQKRAVTLNGSGAIRVVNDLVMAVKKNYDLLGKVRFEYGAGAQTNIPVLSARPAKPTKQSEGATSIAADSTASVGVTTLTPYAYVSVLPVSAEQLVQGAANIDARLPEIFGDAFAYAMMDGMINGDGTMAGIFTDASLTNDANCAATGAPAWTDLIGLAGALKGMMFNPSILINPTFVGGLLGASASSLEALKSELLTRGTIRGLPVIETAYAPTVITAGSVVAVGMDPANYVIAVAEELNLIPIRVKGDTNTYFQAEMFFNGKPILAANGWQLKTV